MSNAIERWTSQAVKRAMSRPSADIGEQAQPSAAARPSAAQIVRRIAGIWAASWVVLFVLCVAVARHAVPLSADAVGAALIATVFTAAVWSDLQRRRDRAR
jgi:hypothetical protein